MYKFLLIIILKILFLNNSFSLETDTEILIKKYFEKKPLNEIEGIWSYYNYKKNKKDILAIYRYQNGFLGINLKEDLSFSFAKTPKNYIGLCNQVDYSSKNKLIYNYQILKVVKLSVNELNWSCEYNINGYQSVENKTLKRIWPIDLLSHNNKFGQVYDNNPSISFNIRQIMNKCSVIGYKNKSKDFIKCVADLAAIQTNRHIDVFISNIKKSNQTVMIIDKLLFIKNHPNDTYLLSLKQQLEFPDKFKSQIYNPLIKKCIIQSYGTWTTLNCI